MKQIRNLRSVLGQFLGFLEQDLLNNPRHLQPLDAKLLDRIQVLTTGVQVDLHAPLSADDE